LEQLIERGSAAGPAGHERAVDGGEREARELVRDRDRWIVAERACRNAWLARSLISQ
jgi:hypothetical protein